MLEQIDCAFTGVDSTMRVTEQNPLKPTAVSSPASLSTMVYALRGRESPLTKALEQ